MAITRPQLDLPDHTVPIWATNTGRTLDPDDTLSDTIKIVKEDGWAISTRAPAKVMNWIQHYVTEWLRSVSIVPVSNWFANADAGAADLDGVVYFPPASTSFHDFGVWTAVSGVNVYRGDNGISWTGIASLTSAANIGAFAISDTYPAIFGTANGLEYNSTGTTFVQVLDGTIGSGFTGGAVGIDSHGDRTIVIDTAGTMRIAASGVNGAWTSPSTPPSLGSTSGIGRVLYAGNRGGAVDVWFAAKRQATNDYLSVSFDDGDTWEVRVLPAFTSDEYTSLAYDPVTQRLVAAGNPSTYYSDDDGVTWTASSTPEPNAAIDVYSCGGGVWVATGDEFGGGYRPSLSISWDNAENWRKVEMHDLYDSARSPLFLMSDGRKLVTVGESGLNGRSLGYPDFS